MMKVENSSSISGMGSAGGVMQAGLFGQGDDAQSQSIRKQIERKQQELSELSGREDVSPEEKMKKRQELVKEISDLNMQLRQHQTEKHMQEKAERQKEQQRAAKASESAGVSGKQGKNTAAGLSTEGMSAMLSADASMKQAKVQGSVANRMENRAGVLKAEMKLEKSEKVLMSKEAALADVEGKAASAANAQAGSLKAAVESAERAAEAERSNHAEDTQKERSKQTENAESVHSQKAEDAEEERGGKTGSADEVHTDGTEQKEKSLSEQYPSVDVRV